MKRTRPLSKPILDAIRNCSRRIPALITLIVSCSSAFLKDNVKNWHMSAAAVPNTVDHTHCRSAQFRPEGPQAWVPSFTYSSTL